MPRLVIWITEEPRANEHWTDEQCASRLLGELHRLERYESRWKAAWGGLALAALAALISVGLLAW